MEHYEFISKTDNKSLFNQIKFLVDCGKESYQNELAIRREHLRKLLEHEEKNYENEFIRNIESRVDEKIRERQESLMKMKQERTKEIEKFVASKKLHQNMLNCLDIREELRQKDCRETQLCQLEQMNEKVRGQQRDKKDEEFWLKVQKRMEDSIDQTQKKEEDLKKCLQAHQCGVLDNQVAENLKLKKMDEDSIRKNTKLSNVEASLKEDKERLLASRNAQIQDIKMNLKTNIEQKRLLKQEAEIFENVFQQETLRQVKKELEDTVRKNAKLKEDTLEYLKYVKKFKNFVANQDKKRDEFHEELDKRFICYKNHSKRSLQAEKRHLAESTHKILLKQICEEQTRRLKLEASERENKMIENRFAKMNVRDRLKERQKFKNDLDEQLKDIDRLKKEQEKKFENELNRAEEDKLYCEELLKKQQIEGCDYLTPHPNWTLLGSNK